MNIATRQIIETVIVAQILQDAVKLGYAVSLNDGYETVVSQSSEVNVILAASRSTDTDTLAFHEPGHPWPVGFVELIYGNDGWDVIADHTDSPRIREILRRAEQRAEKFESQYS